MQIKHVSASTGEIVNMVVNISWITGAVMLLFALLIFTLFIQLTIASCKEEINLLITLGAAPKQLQRFLMKQFFPSNIFIIIIVLIILAALQFFLRQYLSSQSIYVSAYISFTTIIAALLVLIVLWFVNFMTIKKYIAQKKVNCFVMSGLSGHLFVMSDDRETSQKILCKFTLREISHFVRNGRLK